MALPTQFLYELLGAPMRAIVQAEALAARATADFIKEVGFTKNTDANDPDFGDVRTVTFRYQRFKAGGATEAVILEVPLLTLVPIPAIQVAEAEIDFEMTLATPTTSSSNNTQKPFFVRDNIALKGILAPRSKVATPTGVNTANNANMSVKIKLQQADLTHGMIQLMNTLNNSINEKPV